QARLTRVGAFGETQRVGPLLKWADGLPRRSDAEGRVPHIVGEGRRHGRVHESQTAWGDVDKLSVDGRETGPHLPSRFDQVILTFSVPAAALIKRPSPLPGIPLEPETKFIEYGRRESGRPGRRIEVRHPLHVAECS